MKRDARLKTRFCGVSGTPEKRGCEKTQNARIIVEMKTNSTAPKMCLMCCR